MASLAKRLMSLATVAALSGSPAVLSACIALCLPGVAATTVLHEHGAPVGHAAHAAASTPSVVSGHAHHASRASHSPVAAAFDSASRDSSDARLNATCKNCCPDGQVALVAGVKRADPHALGAAPVVSQVTSFVVTTSVLSASPPSPRLAPPRTLLVLRI